MTSDTSGFLDITSEVCPMTFVKTRLMIERMASGQEAVVRLKGEEPLRNVPDSVAELGHEILGLAPEDETEPGGPWRLRIRKR